MSKTRLDLFLVAKKLAPSRSQAESYIKLRHVKVNTVVILKPGFLVDESDSVKVSETEKYVSRAALKLASVSDSLGVDYDDKVVLDVGSSTGGFTDFSLKHGAKRVIAVEVGTDQLHPSLRTNPNIELHERTDIRNVHALSTTPDVVVMDVSFISLREILPHVKTLINKKTLIVAMLKPQFESGMSDVKHKGVIKNDTMRRKIIKDFEQWVARDFHILRKADSTVLGAKGNQERFYLLKMNV